MDELIQRLLAAVNNLLDGESDERADEVTKAVAAIRAKSKPAGLRVSPALKNWLNTNRGVPLDYPDGSPVYLNAVQGAISEGALTLTQLRELNNQTPTSTKGVFNMAQATNTATTPTPTQLLTAAAGNGDGAGAGLPRVKKASEWYSKDFKPGLHVRTGKQATLAGAPVYHPSELALAKIGAFAKHMLRSKAELLRSHGFNVPELREHERQLLSELYHEDAFCGEKASGDWIERATIEGAGLNVKALLDDSLSGGSSLVPFEFDQAIITYPLLHSEILPYVEMRETSSSEVRTATVGNVTVAWGVSEGSDISLFDTDSLVDGLTVPIHPVSAAIEYGKDFAADTPVADFGSVLTTLFGQANMKELDNVICSGNGTNRPEGIFIATGTNALNSDNNTTGPPTLNDYVKLQFGIGKQYRDAMYKPTYITNDTSYQRSRQLKVDPGVSPTDQRLLLGMDLQSYNTLGYPHAVQNSIANTKAAFICLGKFRLYRRSGFDFFATDQGATLARQNLILLIARGRYGGVLTDPNACAKISDMQS